VSESGPLSNADPLAAGRPGAVEDQARSVHSPAAYLADLLQLVEDRFERAALLEARRRIKDIPLDAANTFREVPYLDVVNEVLAGQLRAELGDDAYQVMTGLPAPFAMPFSLDDVTLSLLPGETSSAFDHLPAQGTWIVTSILNQNESCADGLAAVHDRLTFRIAFSCRD